MCMSRAHSVFYVFYCCRRGSGSWRVADVCATPGKPTCISQVHRNNLTTKKHPRRSAPSAILLGCFFVAFDCYYEYLLFLIFLLFHSTTLVSLFDTVIYLIHMFDQAENLICVPPLIIIEADKLEEMSIDLDSFTCIKG